MWERIGGSTLYKENRSLKLDVCFPKYNELLKLVRSTWFLILINIGFYLLRNYVAKLYAFHIWDQKTFGESLTCINALKLEIDLLHIISF